MQRGIPVPPVITEGSKAFILCVPDDPFFYGVVMGALKVMTFNYYWQGTREDVEAVTDRMKTMYYDYQEQVGCMICDMVAECFEEENPRLMEAVAAAMRNNPELRQAISSAITQEGGGVPSAPITEEEAQSDTLPDNVRDSEGNCILDNLWGGMLYLVQSGNRVITDFFEVIEVATNTLETMEIVSQTMPAAGAYISAAAGFADQLAENLQEGYSGAYTEAYEQSLACDLFCAARDGCELTPEQIMNVINARLTAPIDIGDFGELMAGVASGTWVGDEIADVMFLIYFSALRFGQQFGDQIGIRPLSVIISLGADQLSSDNWEILCDCPIVCEEFDFRVSSYDPKWKIRPGTGDQPLSIYSSGVGYIPREQSLGGFQNQIYTISQFECSTLEYVYTAVNTPTQVALFWCNAGFTVLSLAANLTAGTGTVTDTLDLSALTPPPGATGFLLVSGSDTDIDDVVTWQQANFS